MDLLLLAHNDNVINDEEFLLLHEIERSKNLDLPYWKYPRFNLQEMENDECISEFRFEKDDILTLKGILQIPERIICYNGTNICGLEAFCIFFEKICISIQVSRYDT